MQLLTQAGSVVSSTAGFCLAVGRRALPEPLWRSGLHRQGWWPDRALGGWMLYPDFS